MTQESKITAGVVLLTVPTIIYGGSFLLQLLSGAHSELGLNEFQRSMFRAGHAHAGVIVILSLIALLLVDQTSLHPLLLWLVRVGFPSSAIFISAGFFAGAIGQGITKPNSFIAILYVGMTLLVISLITLGVGLIRSKGNIEI